EPEHRRATVAFVHFDGTDELIQRHGAAVAVDAVAAVVEGAQLAADNHGVTFLATDVDHDGGKVILVAGAPLASGDDERRMLFALRDILDSAGTLPLRAGVNRGDVFVGDIGPPYRRAYTVMGDTVNLAARLMAKAAPGQAVATRSVLERSRARFETVAMEPFLVKGKAKPVQAYLLGDVVGSHGHDAEGRLPLFGRDAELATLLEAWDG